MSEATEATKGKRKSGSAFQRPVQPDEKLSAVIGNDPLTRSEMVKKLWEYIRRHGLQDQQQRTMINADEKLKAVFDGKTRVTMFEMTKLVSGHVTA